MLAFDDAALARVMIAACAVPRQQRRQWLKLTAHRLCGQEGSPAARRQRAYRARKRGNVIPVSFVVDADALIAALLGTGSLSPAAVDDRREIVRALADQVSDWASAWHNRP